MGMLEYFQLLGLMLQGEFCHRIKIFISYLWHLGFQVVQGLITTKSFLFIRAGEGQLEISINDGDVPNAVQVLGGGKCLVTYTPEEAITHEIEVTFNDEQVSGKFDFPISIERSKV